jgi:uncharacterized membrane protein
MNKTRLITLVSINAALYTIIGYLTYAGIIIQGVRFWPAVVIPAVFSVLFGPIVGGVGAAIGILISDMLSHGLLLLSLSVGVTSNFAAFYFLGYFMKEYRLRKYLYVVTASLLIGSAIIGVGVWGWSQFFALPGSDIVTPMPLVGALGVFAWTFISEIPFLLLLVPPIVEAVRKALPYIDKE